MKNIKLLVVSLVTLSVFIGTTTIGIALAKDQPEGEPFKAIWKAIESLAEGSGSSQWITSGSNIYYNTGNVGIGTTDPGARLHIGSGTETDNNGILIERGIPITIGDTQGSIFVDEGGVNEFYDTLVLRANTHQIQDYDGTPRITIDQSGNVGIGTTGPGAKLEVAGQIKITGGSPGAGKILTSDANGLATWGTISGTGTVTSVSAGSGLTASSNPITTTGTMSLNTTAISTCTDAVNHKIIWDSTNSRLNCATDQGGGGTGYWTLSGSNLYPNSTTYNVGIGTANPNQLLTLSGSGVNKANLWINNTSAEGFASLATLNDGSTNYNQFITFGTSYGGTRFTISAAGLNEFSSKGKLVVGTEDASALYFGTYNAVRAMINSSGNFGIGTTNPSGRLDVRVASTDGTTKPLVIGKGTTDYVTILNNGNVGIGTANPATSFEIDFTGQNGFRLVGANGARWDLYSGDTAPGDRNWTIRSSVVVYGDISLMQSNAKGGDPFTAGTSRFYIKNDGNVGIGTTDPGTFKLKVAGTVSITPTDIAGTAMVIDTTTGQIGYDIAEIYPASEPVEMGDLVIADPQNPGAVIKSDQPYAPNLIGVVSTKPALAFEEDRMLFAPLSYEFDPLKPNIALVGRAPVKVSIENGEIKIGDFLTSSYQPGVAMKATEAGRVIGMALEPYNSEGVGKIMVFVNPHWYGGQLTEDGSLEGSAETGENSQSFVEKVKQALADLGLFIENGIASVKELIAEKITAKKMCLEGDDGETICITKSQLKGLLEKSGTQSGNNGSSDNSGTGEPPATCDNSHLNLCSTQADCEANSGYWYNETCNAEPEPVCSAEHLDLCTSQELCEGTGLYWYNEVCNSQPQAPVCAPEM